MITTTVTSTQVSKNTTKTVDSLCENAAPSADSMQCSMNGDNNMTTTPEENAATVADNNEGTSQKKCSRPVSTYKIADFAINYLAYLMMQLFGNGISSIETMLGMLGIAITSRNCASWATVGNWLGVAQQKVADVVQKINLENEIKAIEQYGVQQIEDKGVMKWPRTCTYDMGWQKCTSGRDYNSPSGHGFLVGSYTSKVILCICYSKGCRYCVNAWKNKG